MGDIGEWGWRSGDTVVSWCLLCEKKKKKEKNHCRVLEIAENERKITVRFRLIMTHLHS